MSSQLTAALKCNNASYKISEIKNLSLAKVIKTTVDEVIIELCQEFSGPNT